MRKSIFSMAVLVVVPLVIVLSVPTVASPSGSDRSSKYEVKIDNFSFTPASLTITVGSTVTWTNRDDVPHTVVNADDPKSFKSKILDNGEKFSFTFSRVGTYPYYCSIHPKMIGKVVVQ